MDGCLPGRTRRGQRSEASTPTASASISRLLASVVLLGVILAIPQGGARVSYWIVYGDGDGCGADSSADHGQDHADISWEVEYRLEDGSVLGYEYGYFDDSRTNIIQSDQRLQFTILTGISAYVFRETADDVARWLAAYIRQAVSGMSQLRPAVQYGLAAAAIAPHLGAVLAITLAAG